MTARRVLSLAIAFVLAAVAASAQDYFWEQPEVKSPAGVSYSSSASNDRLLAVSWQVRTGKDAGTAVSIYLDIARLDAPNTDTRWAGRMLVHGPVALPNVGEEPRMHAIAMDDRRILAAIVLPSVTGSAGSEILIKSLEDGQTVFREIARFTAASVVTSPDLSRTADGGWLLMVTQAEQVAGTGAGTTQGKLSIGYSVSPDGAAWPELRPLVEERLLQNIQPSHAVMGTSDYVVFQSMRETNHLYLKRSTDGGRTWGTSIPITSGDGFREVVAGAEGLQGVDSFGNQRPSLLALDGRLGLAWERAYTGSEQSPAYQVYYCELDEAGTVVQPREKVSQAGTALYPQVFALGGRIRVLYARQTSPVGLVLATRAAVWEQAVVAPTLDTGTLVSHGAVLRDRLYAFAEVLSAKNPWALYAVRPDTSVSPPAVAAVDFAPERPANRSVATVAWAEPADASRIASYRYSWTREGVPGTPIDIAGGAHELTFDAAEDGRWTLELWATDRAGNTSKEPARLTYVRDMTPPGAVTMFLQTPDGVVQSAPLLADYLPSNDFTIAWTGPEGDRIERYQVDAPVERDPGSISLQLEPGRLQGSLKATNYDNGNYTVTVAAVDAAGNVGPPISISFRLKNYRPRTYITGWEKKEDSEQNQVLSLVGRGFLSRGKITEVYLDLDKAEPYDIIYRISDQEYEVPDDYHVGGITLGAEHDSGTYHIGVRDAARRVQWAADLVDFQAPGTVKIGDFTFRWGPRWAAARFTRLHVPFVLLLVALSAGLIAVLLAASSRRMAATVREGAVLKAEVNALLEGRPSQLTIEETERKIRAVQRRGVGLSVKFSLLVSVLAVIIVAGVAVALGRQMIMREQRILANELKNRSDLLLDSAATRASTWLSGGAGGFPTIANIPAAINAMPGEAIYLTVTGPRVPRTEDPYEHRDYLWATNDPSWNGVDFVQAQQPLEDGTLTLEKVRTLADTLDAAVAQKVGGRPAEYSRLVRELDEDVKVAFGPKGTAADVTAYREKLQRSTQIQAEGRAEINALAKDANYSGSIPPFVPKDLEKEYLFYRPVADFVLDGRYTLGMVRLKVQTKVIRQEIEAATEDLLDTMRWIVLGAIGVGIAGAVILAGITIRPVRKLAAGVAKIRDRIRDDDTTKLEQIEIGTRDEIGTLADAVNEMTRVLVQAAKDKAELLVGKDVQKKFLPLEEAATGEKGSTGGRKTDQVEIYGYYEGAKGVSGDYFDFQQLDARHCAIITCDVSGKGVPAAMIMVEVATLFLGWCRDWRNAAAARGSNGRGGLDALVSTINDMLEERGFKGRFAQLTVGLFDLEKGELTVCTAGNNRLYVYDRARGGIIEHRLPETPAAGVFSSLLVTTGFPQMKLPLNRGDTLFLFSDGIDESVRSFRTYGGDVVACDEEHLGTHKRGDDHEEFGIPRVRGVINAVFGRGTYRLERAHTVTRENLEFDFSGCSGTVRDAVLALVCVEKVFRVYRDALTGPGHRVHLESKVDEFLARHFRSYGELFDHRLDDAPQAGVVAYSHLKEEPQYDDLTLLVVRRP